MIRSHLNDIDSLPADESERPYHTAIRRNAEGEVNQRYDNIIARTPEFYFQADEPPGPTAPPGDDVLAFFGDVEADAAIEADPRVTNATRRRMIQRGQEAIQRAGYSKRDIENMEAFGIAGKFREAVDKRQKKYNREQQIRGVKPPVSESGFFSIREDEEEEET